MAGRCAPATRRCTAPSFIAGSRRRRGQRHLPPQGLAPPGAPPAHGPAAGLALPGPGALPRAERPGHAVLSTAAPQPLRKKAFEAAKSLQQEAAQQCPATAAEGQHRLWTRVSPGQGGEPREPGLCFGQSLQELQESLHAAPYRNSTVPRQGAGGKVVSARDIPAAAEPHGVPGQAEPLQELGDTRRDACPPKSSSGGRAAPHRPQLSRHHPAGADTELWSCAVQVPR